MARPRRQPASVNASPEAWSLDLDVDLPGAAGGGVVGQLLGVGQVRHLVAHVPARRRRRARPVVVGEVAEERLEVALLGLEVVERPRYGARRRSRLRGGARVGVGEEA